MNILLVCSAGMSTSFLIDKMMEAAKERNLHARIWSCGASESQQETLRSDVILIGPQMRFLYQRIKEQAKGKPVRIIDMMTYGRMDGKHAFEMAISAIQEEKTVK